MRKILIEEHIPYLKGILEPYAQVCYMAPNAFTKDAVRDADALIVRTRTIIDDALIEGSAVQCVATATIGTDHIRTKHVSVYSAAGCNAQAVCDYVEQVLTECEIATNSTLGVVGYGHIGTLVTQMAQRMGLRVLISDPFKGYALTVEDLAKQCDVLTFHTPLTQEGEYPTYRLLNQNTLRVIYEDAVSTRRNKLIINAARGGIMDEQAILDGLMQHKDDILRLTFAIDCWENEPRICHELLLRNEVRCASYHIAGYSVAGKRNASQMCLDAICRHFQLPHLTICPDDGIRGDSAPGWLARITTNLKSHPDDFESLRSAYALR